MKKIKKFRKLTQKQKKKARIAVGITILSLILGIPTVLITVENHRSVNENEILNNREADASRLYDLSQGYLEGYTNYQEESTEEVEVETESVSVEQAETTANKMVSPSLGVLLMQVIQGPTTAITEEKERNQIKNQLAASVVEEEDEPVQVTVLNESNLPPLSTVEQNDDVYRILCIGNSVTAHPYVALGAMSQGYWLQDWGMAASAREKDYAHVLGTKLEPSKGETKVEALDFQSWEFAEGLGTPRSTYLSKLAQPLSKKPDLVVLQIGEDCTAYQSLKSDLSSLIDTIRQSVPEAKIVMTGTIILMDPARNAAVDAIKQQVCAEKKVFYADMSGYNETMWVGEGTQIRNEKGEITTISLEQRTHPGDIGMEWIADQILKTIN